MGSRIVSIGKTTNVDSLEEQIKKYRLKSLSKESTSSPSSSSTVPSNKTSLASLCIRKYIESFIKNPILYPLPLDFQDEFLSYLPLDLPIPIAAKNIYYELYWKKRIDKESSSSSNSPDQLRDHGLTWRQYYLEQYISEYLMSYQSTLKTEEEGDDEEKKEKEKDDLVTLLQSCQDHIFSLQLEQLPSHLDLEILTDTLSNLSRLSLTYGLRHIGMQYDRMLFGMKITDAHYLAKCLDSTSTLCTLQLQNNLIDDDLIRCLIPGLLANQTLTTLDFSHNKIQNQGAKLLGKYLEQSNCTLLTLKLYNNDLHEEGGRYLGNALEKNQSLQYLNIGMNRLNDYGGEYLLQGISAGNAIYKEIHLQENSLGEKTMKKIAACLRKANAKDSEVKGLREAMYWDLSGNYFTETDFLLLKETMKDIQLHCQFDLRQNDISKENPILYEIESYTRRNELSGGIGS